MVTVEGTECGLQQMRDDLEDEDLVLDPQLFSSSPGYVWGRRKAKQSLL